MYTNMSLLAEILQYGLITLFKMQSLQGLYLLWQFVWLKMFCIWRQWIFERKQSGPSQLAYVGPILILKAGAYNGYPYVRPILGLMIKPISVKSVRHPICVGPKLELRKSIQIPQLG